jgi:hypothetical protein
MVVLTEADRAALDVMARDDSGSRCSTIRRLIRREARARGIWDLVQMTGRVYWSDAANPDDPDQ